MRNTGAVTIAGMEMCCGSGLAGHLPGGGCLARQDGWPGGNWLPSARHFRLVFVPGSQLWGSGPLLAG